MEALKLKIKVRCKIAELLEAEGRKQTWLAAQIEATPGMVNDWCKGKYLPHVGYILRIQKVTGWTIDQMFEEEKNVE